MRTNLLLTGVLFGLVGGFILGVFSTEEIVERLKDNVSYLIFFCVVLFIISLVGLFTYEKIISKITKTTNASLTGWAQQGSDFINSHLKISANQKDRATGFLLEGVAIYMSWKARAVIFQTLLAVALVFAGTFATFVLLEQNQLIEKQNDAVKIQLMLSEASRNDQYSSAVSQSVQDISDQRASHLNYLNELKFSDDENESSIENRISHGFQLSEGLRSEVENLVSRLRPYPVFDGSNLASDADIALSELDIKYLSPEKGQILKSIMRHRVKSLWGQNLNFNNADMRGFRLPYSSNLFDYMKETTNPIDINYSCFQGQSDLGGISLKNADLSNSLFTNVSFPDLSNTITGSTTFDLSRLNFPMKRDEKDGIPSTIYVSNSSVDFRGDQSLQSVLFASAFLPGIAKSCLEISLQGHQRFGLNAVLPKVNFAGSRMILVFDIENASDADVLQLFDALTEFAKFKDKSWPFKDVFSDMEKLLLSQPSREKKILDQLYDVNSDVNVMVSYLDRDSEQFSQLNFNDWGLDDTLIFDLFFASPKVKFQTKF